MPILKVEGANLHYETFGTGQPLLLITGAGGNGSAWHSAAQHLSQHYTTICYDRRNHSASTITGPQDYSSRLDTEPSMPPVSSNTSVLPAKQSSSETLLVPL